MAKRRGTPPKPTSEEFPALGATVAAAALAVATMPGALLAQQLRTRPELALSRLRRANPNLRLSDLSIDRRGFVVVRSPAFRQGIGAIGDTNPGCNVNCVGGGCT